MKKTNNVELLYPLYVSIVIPELDDIQRIPFDLIDDAVLFVYPSGPVAREGMPERFRFSFPLLRISANVFDKNMNSIENLFVRSLPIQIIFPGLGGKNYFHSINFLSVPLPSSSSFIDSNRRRALRGLLRR